MKSLYSRKHTNQVIYLQRIFSIFEPCLVVVPVIEMHKWKSIYRIVQYISNSFLLALKLPLFDDVNVHCLQTGIYCGLHGGYYIFRFAHHCVLPLLKVKTLPQMKSYRCIRTYFMSNSTSCMGINDFHVDVDRPLLHSQCENNE